MRRRRRRHVPYVGNNDVASGCVVPKQNSSLGNTMSGQTRRVRTDGRRLCLIAVVYVAVSYSKAMRLGGRGRKGGEGVVGVAGR